jgi:predicted MFS family arabinose efflux permease
MSSGYHPSAFPELSKWFPSENRAKAIGVQAVSGLLALAIIPILGIMLVELLGGWREFFFVLGIAGIFFFIPVFFLMRFSKNEYSKLEESQTIPKGADGWTKSFVISLIIMGLRGMTFRCITILMPFYLHETYGFEPIWASSLTTIMLATGLVGEVTSMYLSDKMQRRLPFIFISTGFVAPFLLLLNFSLSGIILIFLLIGVGFFQFLGVPAMNAWLTEISPRDSPSLAFGLLFSIGALPGALAPIIFGALGDIYGLEASILFLVITATLATILTLFLRESKNKLRKLNIILIDS